MKTIEIRPLAKDDDRSDFTCGLADLDRFFEHYAGQNQFKLHLAVSYVALVDQRIVGFATVAASAIERVNVPSARLRKRLPAYPLPVLRLARFAVDQRAQGAGIGRALALFAAQLLLNALWMPVAFGAHALVWALIVIVALWLVLAATLAAFWRIDRLAGALLVPYLAWVSYAVYLNAGLLVLNWGSL